MSVEDNRLSPVPQHTKPISEASGNKGYFDKVWTRWLLELRAKINVINGLLVNFSNLAGAGFPVITPAGTFNIVTLQSGIGINIDNNAGQAGNPLIYTKQKIIAQKADLPAAIAGAIQLLNNTQYIFLNSVDLLGDRINCGTNNLIVGSGAASTLLTSTGLGGALFTSTSSLGFQNIAVSAPTGSLFNLNDGASGNFVFSLSNIVDTPNLGTIQNYANVVFDTGLCLNSANLIVTGNQAAFVSQTFLWDGRPGQTTITVPAGAVFTRRLRFLYSVFVVLPGETGVNVSPSATINDESYIHDNTDFSGGGTYIAGLDYTSNKTAFFRNTGIINSSALCQYSMTGNATATTIAVISTPVKMAGNTVASALNQKFSTAVTNRAVYTGVVQDNFRVVMFASMTSGNNQNIRMFIAKNGVVISESTAKFKTTGSGEASSIGCQALIAMAPTDYVEGWITNDTATTAIVVTDLNLTVSRIN